MSFLVQLLIVPCAVCARAEIVQSENLYADIRDALKILNKMDFDKLIVSVRIHFYSLRRMR
jgi:hypothetical protein